MTKFESREPVISGKNEIETTGDTENIVENFKKKLVSRFRRHAIPGKTPEGASADFLTEEGIEQSSILACDNNKEIKKGFHGPAERTWETLRYMLDSSDREDVKSYEKDELKPMNLPKHVIFEAVFDNGDPKTGKPKPYDEQIDGFINHPDMGEEVQRIGERLAWRVQVALNMERNLKEGADVEVESVTHGPNQEAFLKQVVKLDNNKIGFNSVKEIGGAFKPAEGFEVKLTTNDKGEEGKKLIIFRLGEDNKVASEKELQVDWNKIEELAENYRQKRVAEINNEK